MCAQLSTASPPARMILSAAFRIMRLHAIVTSFGWPLDWFIVVLKMTLLCMPLSENRRTSCALRPYDELVSFIHPCAHRSLGVERPEPCDLDGLPAVASTP